MRLRRPQSAQALVMVTFSLFAIVGLIGLAVDFGWMYFLQKNMQSAADAAALAAVRYSMERATSIADYRCGGSIATCTGAGQPVSCTTISSGNLLSACLYATQNGFNASTSGINVRLQASDSVDAPTVVGGCSPAVNHPPTAPCVNTFYWVTVRIAQQVPQLFSAITGNTSGLVAARATAAVAESTVIGSLILINRENDNIGGALPVGTNLNMQGSGTVTVPGGIVLASSSSTANSEAGRIQGSGHVTAPFTNVRDTGTIGGNAAANWQNPAVNSPDSSGYWDPMWQKGGQPPLNADENLPIREVLGGVLNENNWCTGGICPPGIYYASEPACPGCPNTKPSGGPIRLGSPSSPNFRFAGNSPGFTGFGDFYFIGGLDIRNNTVLAMDPGRYAFLGVSDTRDSVLNIPNGVTMTGGACENCDAGRIMITSDWKSTSTYPGLSDIWTEFWTSGRVQGTVDALWQNTGLQFSKTSIQAGQNDRSVIQVYGLKKNDPDVIQAGLNQFTPAVYWQDQRNSYVRYDSTGKVDISCDSLNSPCLNSPAPNPADAPQLEIWATPNARWGGMIYQPRGAWTRLQASGTDTGPLMIVTGGLNVQGTGDLTLTGPATPLTVFTVALVE